MANLIETSCVREGMIFKFEDDLYECINAEHTSVSIILKSDIVPPRKTIIHARRISDHQIVRMTFILDESVELVDLTNVKVSYLYENDGYIHFIDTDTFDEIVVASNELEWEKNFLTADVTATCCIYNDKVVKVLLPDSVQLTVTSCDQHDGAPLKTAICETGWKLKVPLFIVSGETIIVSTSDGKYQGRRMLSKIQK